MTTRTLRGSLKATMGLVALVPSCFVEIYPEVRGSDAGAAGEATDGQSEPAAEASEANEHGTGGIIANTDAAAGRPDVVGTSGGSGGSATTGGSTGSGGDTTAGDAKAGVADGCLTMDCALDSDGGGDLRGDGPSDTSVGTSDAGLADGPPPESDPVTGAWCRSREPTFAFLDGFESYPDGWVTEVSGSPWVALNPSAVTGDVSTGWVRSCSQSLHLQGLGRTIYVPLDLPSRPSRLNLELWYSPTDTPSDLAEIGLGAVNGSILSKIFSVDVEGTVMTASTPWASPVVVTDGIEVGPASPRPAAHNYVRIEIDFCALTARFFVGSSRDAPLQKTVDLEGTDPFDAFYITAGLGSVFIDDLVITTPGSAHDRDELCAAELLGTFSSPGSRCSGLGWDGSALWLLDNLGTLYELDEQGGAVGSLDLDFEGQGLSWDGTGFWTRNNDSGTFGTQVVRVRKNGTVEPGPAIFAQHGYSDWESQGQRYEDAFWTISFTYNTMRKWSTAGVELLNWDFSALTASGLLVRDDAIYTATGIWRGSSDYDTGLTKYSLTGTELGTHDLSQLGVPSYAGGYSIASDGSSYYLCSESGFDVYHLRLPL